MKHTVFVVMLGVLLTVAVDISAQSAGDIGLVLKVKSYCYANRNFYEDSAEFSCRPELEFQNNGSSPVILINPNLGYGTGLRGIVYYYDDFNFQTRISKIIGEGKVDIGYRPKETESFEAMARLFDSERPPENFTVTLQPNETFKFNDSVFVRLPLRTTEPAKTYKRLDPETGKFRTLKMPARKMEPHCYRLVYEYSFLPYVADPDFLENLNLRWKRFGQMPIGANGSYTVTSEIFPCTLN